MKTLPFKDIKKNMNVLYRHDSDIYAVRVVDTSLGHPSIPTVRLSGGFVVEYGRFKHEDIYDDSPTNRTELLLEAKKVNKLNDLIEIDYG